MREEWDKYLLSKVQLQALPKRNAKKAKEPKGFGVLDGVVASPGKKAELSSISKQEHDALLAAASEVSKRISQDIVGEDYNQKHVDAGDSVKGKGKGKKKKGSAGEKNNNDVVPEGKSDTFPSLQQIKTNELKLTVLVFSQIMQWKVDV